MAMAGHDSMYIHTGAALMCMSTEHFSRVCLTMTARHLTCRCARDCDSRARSGGAAFYPRGLSIGADRYPRCVGCVRRSQHAPNLEYIRARCPDVWYYEGVARYSLCFHECVFAMRRRLANRHPCGHCCALDACQWQESGAR